MQIIAQEWEFPSLLNCWHADLSGKLLLDVTSQQRANAVSVPSAEEKEAQQRGQGVHSWGSQTLLCLCAQCHLSAWCIAHPIACVGFLIIFNHISTDSFWHAVLSTEAHKNSARGVLALFSYSICLKLFKKERKNKNPRWKCVRRPGG